MLFYYPQDSKKENSKCCGGKLMQKLEEKVEDEDSLLRMQDKPNMSLLTQ